MWDLRSRQQVRLLQNPVKGPVTALLALIGKHLKPEHRAAAEADLARMRGED
jgi:hypothetical protein